MKWLDRLFFGPRRVVARAPQQFHMALAQRRMCAEDVGQGAKPPSNLTG